ncbi:conidiation-specific protein 10 [Fusarium austroafricanum]|uniref:Conidiation-specific protein 10 n=1 Tax=Fusarium austroafricanum TaxID=2364996 RepID=A0A8H4P4A8_9HYPO|nr:conidiation-specific protein 10 [Fusarium austroafricanum]
MEAEWLALIGRSDKKQYPKEEVQEIASKGGQASHSGGFANMDPDKQREIASEGGKASSGSFEPGSEKAKEAGRKGGLAS